MPHGPPEAALFGLEPIGDHPDTGRCRQALEATVQQPEEGEPREGGAEAETDVQEAAHEEPKGEDTFGAHEISQETSQEPATQIDSLKIS